MARIAPTRIETDPVINGGNYIHRVTGEEAIIMGVLKDENSGKRIGCLYTFKRGPLPSHVTEGDESMVQWELSSAGSKSAATTLVNAHKKALKE